VEPTASDPATSADQEAAVVAAERAQAELDRAERGRRRTRQSVRDMTLSMLVVGVVVILIAQPWRQNATQTAERVVPWQGAAQSARAQVDWPVLVPAQDPVGWTPTSARVSSTVDGRTALHIGWLTAAHQYAALEQSDTADVRYLDQSTSSGRPTGESVVLTGRSWDRWTSGDGGTRCLVQVRVPQAGGDAVSYVVTGSAGWAELEALASSLR
jgi:hypothetical protein